MRNNGTKIAILSGKGGTGKTLISVNLASSAETAVYIDCDVDEPNGHLYFKPKNIIKESIKIKMPTVNASLCTGCRKCVDFCKFNALAFIKSSPYVFEDVCHSCGGCILLCPEKALAETEKIIGELRNGTSGNVIVNTGILIPGEESGVPIIKRLLENSKAVEAALTIIDCPPGSNCVVMESIKDADYCVLVAEPTVFGAHNLSMVYELVKLFNKPYGVVLNKCVDGENPSEEFCIENDIQVLCKIPFDNKLGKLNSDAKIAVRETKKYNDEFTSLLQKILEEVKRETDVSP